MGMQWKDAISQSMKPVPNRNGAVVAEEAVVAAIAAAAGIENLGGNLGLSKITNAIQSI
jgi:hypothetical protein